MPECELESIDVNHALFRADGGQYLFHVPSLRVYRGDRESIDSFVARTSLHAETLQATAPQDGKAGQGGERVSRICAVTFHLTDTCDMRCRYCFARQASIGPTDEKSMRASTAIAAIDALDESQLLDPGGVSFNFFGGEPLMNFPTLRSIVEYVERKFGPGKSPYTFNCTTNGLSLTRERRDFFTRHNVKVVISIDGEPGAHDENRIAASGRKTHALVLANAQAMLAERPDLVSARATLTPSNIDLVGIDGYFADAGIENYGLDIVMGAGSNGESFWTDERVRDFDLAYGRYME